MPTAANSNDSRSGDVADGGGLIVRPQTTAIGAVAEQSRSIAEIQAALTVAKNFGRDEVTSLDRIKNACQRQGMAEKAEYSYSRGGTEITGPTIDLLTMCANCWGNVQFGFRELSQTNGESTVEAFAWDLETNSKRTVTFTVQHKRFTKSGSYPLTDPRDIYETVANNAQRRVRACLESVIPPDVVEDAVAQCRQTLKDKCDVTSEAIKKMVSAFGILGVAPQQIEKRIARRLDSMQPAQMISLRRIYKSIQDGMSKPEDWFPADEASETPAPPKTGTEGAKELLKKKAKPTAPAVETAPGKTKSEWITAIAESQAVAYLEGLHSEYEEVRGTFGVADDEEIEAAFAVKLGEL